jgi:hypothetical protein
MSETFQQVLSSVNNTELRIALEKLLPKIIELTLLNSIQFNTAYPNGVAHPEGHLHWDASNGTMSLRLLGGTVDLQVGQENVTRCFNQTGSTITNGSAVYVIDAGDQKPRIGLADADNTNFIPEAVVMGLATEDIEHGSQGFVCTQGLVRDIPTGSFTEGVPLWLSAVTPGGITETRPNAPNLNIAVGYCIYSHATSGIILVNPVLIPKLQGLSDVDKTSPPSNGDTVRWNTTNDRWEYGV